MPVKEKYLWLYDDGKNYRSEHAQYTYSNPCGEIKYFNALAVFFSKKLKQNPNYQVCEPDRYLPLVEKYNNAILIEGFSQGIQKSDLTIIYQKALHAIQEKNALCFATLLQTEFIYGPTPHSAHYGNISDWTSTSGAYYKVRPNLEALRVHRFDYFVELINSLIEANDDALYCAFLNSLSNTDLKNGSILLWNEPLKNKILTQLDAIKAYGRSLQTNADVPTQEEGKLAIEIADELFQKIVERPNDAVEQHHSQPTYQAQFENLKFKLQLIDELHRGDKLAANHREIKDCIANFCSVLLTDRMATTFRYFMPGNALFFTNSQSPNKRVNTQHGMDFDVAEQAANADKKTCG